MIWLVIVAVVVVFLIARRRGRKRKTRVGTDALVDALGLIRPYEGKKWKVDRPWL